MKLDFKSPLNLGSLAPLWIGLGGVAIIALIAANNGNQTEDFTYTPVQGVPGEIDSLYVDGWQTYDAQGAQAGRTMAGTIDFLPATSGNIPVSVGAGANSFDRIVDYLNSLAGYPTSDQTQSIVNNTIKSFSGGSKNVGGNVTSSNGTTVRVNPSSPNTISLPSVKPSK